MWAGRRGGKNEAGQVEDCHWLDKGRSKCCNALVRYIDEIANCTHCRRDCDVYPCVGLIVEPRFRDIEDIVMPIFRKYLGPPGNGLWDYKQTKARMEIYKWSGGEYTSETPYILFDSAEYPDRLGHGKSFDFVHFDELRDHKDFQLGFDTMKPTLADRSGYFWGSTTANGEDPAYVFFQEHMSRLVRAKDMLSSEPQEPFIEYFPDGDEDFEMYKWRTIDNPYLPPGEVEIARRTMSAQMFRQEYMASIEQFKGLVYPDYKPNRHFIEPVEVDSPLWFLGIDFGWNHPTGIILVGENAGHQLFVVDEIEENHKDAGQIHNLCVNLLKRNGLMISDLEYAVFDTAGLQSEISSGGMSVYDQLLDPSIIGSNTVLPLRYADKAVMAGIMRVTQLFRLDALKIFNRCVKLDRQLRGYRWPEKLETVLGNRDVRPIKKNDDLADPLRYIVMSRPDWFGRDKTDIYGVRVKDEYVEDEDPHLVDI